MHIASSLLQVKITRRAEIELRKNVTKKEHCTDVWRIMANRTVKSSNNIVNSALVDLG